MALISISKDKNGSAKNPVLRDYYLKKCEAKPKMVALGAVMHKVCNIVFAILRDEKEFQIITPEEHHNWFTKRLQSDNVLLYIFCADGRPAGQGRLDLLGYTAEISYGLAPEFRGKGLGRKS
jgi:RimJ/RimL family protein N-acetyltransferase